MAAMTAEALPTPLPGAPKSMEDSPARWRRADSISSTPLQLGAAIAAIAKRRLEGPNVVPQQLHRVDDLICGHNGTA
jgi:hypothetical protein